MSWMIEVVGEPYDLEDLSKVCKSEELRIENVGESYFLTSSAFDEDVAQEDVYRYGVELLERVSGALRIASGSRSPVRLATVIHVDIDGKRHYYTYGSLHGSRPLPRLIITLRGADGVEQEIVQAAPVPRWIKLAKRDEKVAKVLKIFAEDDLDFNKLNIIFEDIEDDAGEMIERWMGNDKKRFTQTVQPYRHGASGLKKCGWRRHVKPMEYYEARSFVVALVSRWITWKEQDESSTT